MTASAEENPFRRAVQSIISPVLRALVSPMPQMLFMPSKELVFEQKKVSMEEYKRALADNFGRGFSKERITFLTKEVAEQLGAAGKQVTPEIAAAVASGFRDLKLPEETVKRYDELLKMIDELPKYGNDIREIDEFAREVAYTYTKPLEQYKNPRGGRFQAGLYPVSANVPLGAQTGSNLDGKTGKSPIADGVGPVAGRDVHGPTATANSVAAGSFIASMERCSTRNSIRLL